MSRFIGFVFALCLLAIGTSTSVPAASPDWPKSLMLSTTGPGGSFYIFGEKLAPILTEKTRHCSQPHAERGPDPKRPTAQ
jgi:TRAP-type uncharacterized transport system substrate-binding protein